MPQTLIAADSMYYGSSLACDEHTSCAKPLYTFVSKDVKTRDGSCLFNAPIIAGELKCTAQELRASLLNSPYLKYCMDPAETTKILSSPDL